MITVICPNCKKTHNVDEKLIPAGENVNARCRSCKHRFPVNLKSVKANTTVKKSRKKKYPTRTIGVSLSKGGVGKTTTAVNLSAGLALAGHKVLLVDTDTQGQDSYMLGLKPKAGLTEFLTGELAPDEAIVEARENLWLLAGGKSLAGVRRMIDRKSFGGELTMAEALTPLEERFDYIIVDTSPGWDPLTVNVLFYVNEVLVPVALEIMALQGLVEFQKSLASIQKYRKEVNLKYILPTFMDKRVKYPETIFSKLKQLYGNSICSPIRYNVNLVEAPAYGQTIFEYSPGCNATADYRELVKMVSSDNNKNNK